MDAPDNSNTRITLNMHKGMVAIVLNQIIAVSLQAKIVGGRREEKRR